MTISALAACAVLVACDDSSEANNQEVVSQEELSSDATIEIEINSSGFIPAEPGGQLINVEIRPNVVAGNNRAEIGYQWVDFRGESFSNITPLIPGEWQSVVSPGVALPIGYYGLRFIAGDEVVLNSMQGSRRELGFAILPRIENRLVDIDSGFGVIHFDDQDPYLDPGWIKTATEYQIGWDGTVVESDSWLLRLAGNRERGQLELPLISGDAWRDSTAEELRIFARQLINADPRLTGTVSIPAYELGREENLSLDWTVATLNETAEKFRIFGAERDQVDPGIKLIYQVATVSVDPIETLFESELIDEMDVLAIHPYAWDEFESPDLWHDRLVNDVEELIERTDKPIPIWYTEVGAPQNDAEVAEMRSEAFLIGDGQTRSEHAAYLVKLHAHAFAAGIEKVFWYNYQDDGTSLDDVEDHFGLIDHWGSPKPAYLAYAAVLRCMKNRQASKIVAADGARLTGFLFADLNEQTNCVAIWNASGEMPQFTIEELQEFLGGREILSAEDTVGTPIFMGNNSIWIDEYPVFLTVR